MTSLASFLLEPRTQFALLLGFVVFGWVLAWREVVRWERHR